MGAGGELRKELCYQNVWFTLDLLQWMDFSFFSKRFKEYRIGDPEDIFLPLSLKSNCSSRIVEVDHFNSVLSGTLQIF